MFNNISIRIKLALLAGVPVIGALALASLLWSQAQKSAEAAAALGSVEDLAELSSRITSLVHRLQTERANLGLTLGHETRAAEELMDDAIAAEHAADGKKQRVLLGQRFIETDEALTTLRSFLETKNLAALPGRLTRNLKEAVDQLQRLKDVRQDKERKTYPIDKAIAYYAKANEHLIEATAALTQLSDDGELLRSISALVSVLQVKERGSQEHALLANVFAAGSFPPGTYRSFVKLTTEEEVYVEVLRSNARDEHVEQYLASLQADSIKNALAMRAKALNTIDDDFGIDSNKWFAAQNEKIEALRKLETVLTQDVRVAAIAKVRQIEANSRTSLGLSAAVLLASVLLGLVIARGVSRSLRSLGNAAQKVQEEQDFDTRAQRFGSDELGVLTDTFNHMLDGIQKRDKELEEYRVGLEDKVAQRTAELSERNDAMRMVLDNVDQGLVTVGKDGKLSAERSAIFDQWFGSPANDVEFSEHLGGQDAHTKAMLSLGWGEVVEGFMPLELTLDQMPKQLLRGDSHFTLAYKPIGDEEDFKGALVVVSDITEEVKRREEEARQREFIAVFERVMKDKNGFVEFFNETEKIVRRVQADEQSVALMMRDIHTVKGNTAIFQVSSVAEICHDVESNTDAGQRPSAADVSRIVLAWDTFAERVRTLLGEGDEEVLELAYGELEELLRLTRIAAPHTTIRAKLLELRHEPTQARFARIAEQAKSIAERVGKPGLEVKIEGNDVRLPAERWSPFWTGFAHVLRNALDHGIESPEVRRAAGKPEHGTLTLRSKRDGDRFVIELADDGGGIPWDAVRARAKERGLPHKTQDDLKEAIFSDGFSTKEEASDISGRGVGMAAVRQITADMDGRLEIESSDGKGALMRFSFPILGNDQAPRSVRNPGARPSIAPSLPPKRSPKVARSA